MNSTPYRNLAAAWTAAVLALAIVSSPGRSETPLVGAPRIEPPERHPSRVLVRFKPGATASGETALRRLLPQARTLRTFRSIEGLTVVSVPKGETAEAITTLNADAGVLYAEPDYRVEMFGMPNDPFFGELWGLHNTGQIVNADPGIAGADIRALEAWALWSGDPTFRIAVIDTGINYKHPDLLGNMWVNPGEIPGNGIDDDANGWIDDVHGFNTFANNGDPLDENGHGSHIAGTIGAVGDDGQGLVGINWRCNLVALRFGDAGGGGFISDAIEALQYVIDTEIRVSNNSWGCYQCFSQALYDAIEATQTVGHVFVAASGNGIFGLGVDTDEFPAYPASYDLPNIISVAATDNDDDKTKFSNFGRTSVDFGAPGATILSSITEDGYDYFDGTSMAAPHVTGVVALTLSRLPDLTFEELRTRLLLTARPIASLQGITVSGGVVNALGAVGDCNENGIFDEFDILTGNSADCNNNGVPDECEPDCNENDIADECDILFGISDDCDENGVPDECQPDCNGNELADTCDISSGSSSDCNENGIPDECESGHDQDCNLNGVPDLCDLFFGAGTDCNGNHVLDSCDIGAGNSLDCTENGLPDECERDCNDNDTADSCDIVDGTSKDIDGNGVPDECSLGFSLVPVSSTRPSLIDGQEIQIVSGGNTIVFEIRISGWDPDQDGEPRLRLYQATIERSGLSSGEKGELSLARVPCVTSDDCIAESNCMNDGYCDFLAPIAVDEGHPEYVFSGLPTISLGDPSRIRLGSTVFNHNDSLVDPGVSKYAGTLILDVSADAVGIFVIGFVPIDTFFGDPQTPTQILEPLSFLPARVVIAPDCNGNGHPDEQDIQLGTSGDCDADGVPDECVGGDRDCNQNLLPDICDTRDGTSPDCNGNTIPDECIDRERDCNNNLSPDECDLADGTSEDCNGNGTPDECIELERDCNDNLVPDACDIADATEFDCNENGVPDTCENDCNGNALADECDIADGRSEDNDQNDVPDECQTMLRVPADYPTIQQAIDAAVDGDIVVLEPGEYRGAGNAGLDFRGKHIILRGLGGADSTLIDCTNIGVCVQFMGGEGRNARLEDVTIANAFNAGVICFGGGPTLRRCIIHNNGPISAGILLDRGCDALIEDCTITNNFAGFSGGGIRAIRSAPVIRRCFFSGNTAYDYGGAVYGFLSNLTMTECDFWDNFGDDGGGGIALTNGAPHVSGCTFHGNRAGALNAARGEGGAIHALRTAASIHSCVISGNISYDVGGGIYIEDGDPTFTNLTIVGNYARTTGGGVYLFGHGNTRGACCFLNECGGNMTLGTCNSFAGLWYPGLGCSQVACGTRTCCLPNETCENLTMLDCIAKEGTPKLEGSQCSSHGCSPTIRNSIAWDNRASLGFNIATDAPFLTVANSIINGGWYGDEILAFDPEFRTPGAWLPNNNWGEGDYHLEPSSVGIDAGAPVWLDEDAASDLDGHPRVLCDRVDLGAYEFGIGDYDCDRLVNLFDFANWTACLTGLNTAAYPSGCQAFDFDADEDVDLRDFRDFQNLLGQAGE